MNGESVLDKDCLIALIVNDAGYNRAKAGAATALPKTRKARPQQHNSAAASAAGIGEARAAAMREQLQSLGLDVGNEAQIIERAIGLSPLDWFAQLDDTQAKSVWSYARGVAAKARPRA